MCPRCENVKLDRRKIAIYWSFPCTPGAQDVVIGIHSAIRRPLCHLRHCDEGESVAVGSRQLCLTSQCIFRCEPGRSIGTRMRSFFGVASVSSSGMFKAKPTMNGSIDRMKPSQVSPPSPSAPTDKRKTGGWRASLRRLDAIQSRPYDW